MLYMNYESKVRCSEGPYVQYGDFRGCTDKAVPLFSIYFARLKLMCIHTNSMCASYMLVIVSYDMHVYGTLVMFDVVQNYLFIPIACSRPYAASFNSS